MQCSASTVRFWAGSGLPGTLGYTDGDGSRQRSLPTQLPRQDGADEIIGHFSYPAGCGPEFLWRQGSVTVIDFTRVVPGASLTVPCRIHDAGQIVGYYTAAEAKYHVPGGRDN
jgi:hypothetical protein